MADSQKLDKQLINALMREDFQAFVEKAFMYVNPGTPLCISWHIEAICFYLKRMLRGDYRRGIINLPPRSLKSFIVSVALPAWIHGQDPSARIITIAYGEELSKQHMMMYRQIMEADWYRSLFPATVIGEWKNSDTELWTTANGYRLCASAGGPITGRGGNYIIIDDPHKADDANYPNELIKRCNWYSSTIPSRLDDKQSGIILVVMQRLDVNDLSGYLADKGGFEILSLPARNAEDQHIALSDNKNHFWKAGELLQPEREDQKVLDELRNSMGERAFAAQYLQNPVPREGAFFKTGSLQRFKKSPERFDRVILSCDPASKTSPNNDYSAVVLCGIVKNKYYILQVWQMRVELPFLINFLTKCYPSFNADVLLVEETGIGIAIIQHIRAQACKINIQAFKSKMDKATRAERTTIVAEAGRLFLPEEAPWLPNYERELFQFPAVKHDDQVDATTQIICWNEIRRPLPTVGIMSIPRSDGFRHDWMVNKR